MRNFTVDLSRVTAAVGAAVLSAVSVWAFVSSTASSERDPFQFAAVMASNARVHTTQVQAHNPTPVRCNESQSTSRPAAKPVKVCQPG